MGKSGDQLYRRLQGIISLFDELDVGLCLDKNGSDLSEDEAWIFTSRPNELRLHRRLVLHTRFGRWMHASSSRGWGIVLFCVIVYACLHMFSFNEFENIMRGEVVVNGWRKTTPLYGLSVTILSLVVTFVVLHYVNKDLFLRQLHSFDSFVIVGNGIMITVLQMLYNAQQFGRSYDHLWMAVDVVRGLASIPVFTLLATLDSIRMRNFWKVLLLIVVCSLAALEYSQIQRNVSLRSGECMLGLRCQQLQRAYLSSLSTMAAFWARAVVAYAAGLPFAVVKPTFASVPRKSGHRWSLTRTSTLFANTSKSSEVCSSMDVAHGRTSSVAEGLAVVEQRSDDGGFCVFDSKAEGTASSQHASDAEMHMSEEEDAFELRVPRTTIVPAAGFFMVAEPVGKVLPPGSGQADVQLLPSAGSSSPCPPISNFGQPSPLGGGPSSDVGATPCMHGDVFVNVLPRRGDSRRSTFPGDCGGPRGGDPVEWGAGTSRKSGGHSGRTLSSYTEQSLAGSSTICKSSALFGPGHAGSQRAEESYNEVLPTASRTHAVEEDIGVDDNLPKSEFLDRASGKKTILCSLWPIHVTCIE